MKNNYNGWTNYATWRVNLEILGDIQWVEEEIEVLNEEMLEDYVENAVFHSETTGLIADYAHAFLNNVNYREILEHILEDYKLNTI